MLLCSTTSSWSMPAQPASEGYVCCSMRSRLHGCCRAPRSTVMCIQAPDGSCYSVCCCKEPGYFTGSTFMACCCRRSNVGDLWCCRSRNDGSNGGLKALFRNLGTRISVQVPLTACDREADKQQVKTKADKECTRAELHPNDATAAALCRECRPASSKL